MSIRSTFGLLSSTLTIFLIACGGPLPVANGILDPGNGTGSGNTGVCAAGAEGADDDADGVTNACEDLLGLDKNDPNTTKTNDIPDGQDVPPCESTNTCLEGAKQDFMNRLLSQMGNSMLVGGSAFTGTAPPGTYVKLSNQKLHIYANQKGEQVGSVATFCSTDAGATLTSYLYIELSGSVCTSDGASGCDKDSNYHAATLSLCAANAFEGHDPTLEAPVTLTNFKWTAGMAANNGSSFKFNPGALIASASSSTASVVLTGQNKVTNSESVLYFDRLETLWTSTYQISGTIKDDTGQPVTVNYSDLKNTVKKDWKRTGSANLDYMKANLGITGPWTNSQ